jgi:hypothetical protein
MRGYSAEHRDIGQLKYGKHRSMVRFVHSINS